ncbi:MAG: Bug family tripartite tricarboxylate transporter substrate binding protein [Lautropia sp.]
MNRSISRSIVAAFAAVVMSGAASAQDFPARPIKLIVPLGAGGASDLNARVLAEGLGARLGRAVVVENRPGAEGIIGVDAAAKSAPDGYTLVLGSSTTLAANYSLRAKLPFHPVNDFVPVSMAFKNAFNMLVINPDVPAKDLNAFVTLARTKPAAFFYGTATSGSKLCAEMFKSAAKVDLQMVNYKSSPQALSDLLAGQIHLVCEPIGTALAHVRAGRLRSLGVTSPSRVKGVEDQPTVAESGLPGFAYSAWVGVFAPAGTPPDIVARLDREIQAVLQDPEVARRINVNGFDPMIGGPKALAELLSTEMARSVKVVKDAGIQPQ